MKIASHLMYFVKFPIASYSKWLDELKLPSPLDVTQNKIKYIQNKTKIFLTF
jgi:hypothetical protein